MKTNDLRYGDIVEYNHLRFMVVRRHDEDSVLGFPQWLGIVVDRSRQNIVGTMLTIGMSSEPRRIRSGG